MITVEAGYFSDGKKKSCIVSLRQGSTIFDLLDKLNLCVEEDFLVIVDGANRLKDYKLKDYDKVMIFPPMSGG